MTQHSPRPADAAPPVRPGRARLAHMLALALALGLGACLPDTDKSAEGEARKDEDGQVVARVDGEEITIHQVNSELQRSGLLGSADEAARDAALQAIVRRKLLANAAMAERLDRNPLVVHNLEAARDAVMGEAYMMQELAVVTEPSLTEIDDFIARNPLLFTDRRSYVVRVIEMPSEAYTDEFVPLFDETPDFTAFKRELLGAGVAFDEARSIRLSSDFPEAVRERLAQLGVNDNLVLRTRSATQILKVEAITPMPLSTEQARVAARSILLQDRLRRTAGTLDQALAAKAEIAYYGAFDHLNPQADEPALERIGPLDPDGAAAGEPGAEAGAEAEAGPEAEAEDASAVPAIRGAAAADTM
ncbi:MAG: peptidyl-prolyl cis-trans isomerase, EpsD family [Alphaproteobacteria bacterium]|nr:peptidyl-prolyl cis-trans isomerase, EpsD family [Alphaproteobacteria bacterium]